MSSDMIIDKIWTPEKIQNYNRRKPAMAPMFKIEKENIFNNNCDLSTLHVLNTQGQELTQYIQAKDTGSGYVNSAEYHKRWNKINYLRRKIKEQIANVKSNIIQFPTDYYDLVQQVVTDLTRRRVDEIDYTGIISREETKLNAPNPMQIKELLPYAGEFGLYESGQPVNMIQQKTGDTGSFPLYLYALGFTRSLYSVLFDIDLFDFQKVMEAVSRAHKGLRNSFIFDVFTTTTFHASQTQAADTAGDTYDLRLYNTIRDGIELLEGLLDMQTGQQIPMTNVTLLLRNKITARRINTVVNGYLQGVGTNSLINLSPLNIDNIITYQGDSWVYGKKTVTYDGIGANDFYLFVSGPAGAPWWTINKAPLTQEVGKGNVLTLEMQERRAWWFGQGSYYKEFLGSSDANVTAPWTSGYGYVIKGTLPSTTDPS